MSLKKCNVTGPAEQWSPLFQPEREAACHHEVATAVESNLQRLTADEVAPPAHLGWYSLGLGQLLAHALGEEHGRL